MPCPVQTQDAPVRVIKECHRTETSNMENTKTVGNTSFLERDNRICVKQCMP